MPEARQPPGGTFLAAWILASAVGLAAGFGLARALVLALGGEVYWDTGAPSYGRLSGAAAWLVAGAALGTAQWVVLRRWSTWAAAWPLAVGLLLALPRFGGTVPGGRVTMPFIPGGVLGGLVVGVLTGVPMLVWLRWRRPPSAPTCAACGGRDR